jgi:CRP-like cAMP-binding protein
MSDHASCLVAKLSNFAELTEDDQRLLARLEEDTRSYPANHTVFRGGEGVDNLYVVKRGWLFSSSALEDGRRQVMMIHNPGDIIGLPHLPFRRSLHDLSTSTPVELCPFPKDSLDTILSRSPRLTALLFAFSMVEQAVLFDRLQAIGRMRARERVCHLLLSLRSRLRLTNDVEKGFSMPLNQTVIGDALGLTNVSVSRVMTGLEQEGVLTRGSSWLWIHSPEELSQHVEFEERYAHLDTSWFPSETSAST